MGYTFSLPRIYPPSRRNTLPVIKGASFMINRTDVSTYLMVPVRSRRVWSMTDCFCSSVSSPQPLVFSPCLVSTKPNMISFTRTWGAPIRAQVSGSKAVDSLHVAARFGSSTAVKEGIKAGLGISILPSRALETELKTGILKALKVQGLAMQRKFYLIRDKRRHVSPLCQAMLDFLLAASE